MSKISRRNLIKSGLLGTTGIVSGVNSRQLFATADIEVPYFVFVHCDGGWDPTMVFDNHIGESIVAQESGAYAKTSGTIDHVAHSNRTAVDDFFTAYGSGTALVNGLATQSMNKAKAIENMLGATPKGGKKPVDWLTYYAANMNPLHTMPHLVIDGPYMPGEYESSAIYLTTDMIAEYTSALSNADSIGTDGETALTAFYKSRHEDILSGVNTKSLDYEKLRTISAAYTRESTISSNINTITTTLGSQGSESDFLRAGKIAMQCFSSGYSQCATLRAGGKDSWDTSVDNFSRQSTLYQSLFSDLKDLIDYAATVTVGSTTLDKRIVLVVTSERGRNPKLNDDSGKTPWSYTSALLWGQIVQGGITAVGTDTALRGTAINPLVGSAVGSGDEYITMKHIMSALYTYSGLSTKKILKAYQPLIPIVVT
jgi:uncharacterized protein (DUF1501 family)